MSTMIPKVVRRFFATWVGTTKPDQLPQNWQGVVSTAVEKLEKENPQIKKAEIKGSKPHKSHKDPSDPQDVISIRLLDEGDSRIETIHVHEDGSVKRK